MGCFRPPRRRWGEATPQRSRGWSSLLLRMFSADVRATDDVIASEGYTLTVSASGGPATMSAKTVYGVLRGQCLK